MGLGALLGLGWDGRAELARGGGGARFADLGGSRKRASVSGLLGAATDLRKQSLVRNSRADRKSVV